TRSTPSPASPPSPCTRRCGRPRACPPPTWCRASSISPSSAAPSAAPSRPTSEPPDRSRSRDPVWSACFHPAAWCARSGSARPGHSRYCPPAKGVGVGPPRTHASGANRGKKRFALVTFRPIRGQSTQVQQLHRERADKAPPRSRSPHRALRVPSERPTPFGHHHARRLTHAITDREGSRPLRPCARRLRLRATPRRRLVRRDVSGGHHHI